MTDEVPTCPDCGTSSLGTSGSNYWCQGCCEPIPKDEAVWREAREWADRAPKRGLAAKLDETDPEEVTGE
jgi:tRNA(Ile2) C34 agmatinyltransferase TiaS